jgi:hypothetical protein
VIDVIEGTFVYGRRAVVFPLVVEVMLQNVLDGLAKGR